VVDRGETLLQVKESVSKTLGKHVKELSSLQCLHYASSRYALLLIFQGMDAGGKDRAIRHVMSGVNPQGCETFSFKQPSEEELKHDFLWRTTRHLPERGRIGIFNRSYYEEVLVVRVHPEILRGQGLPDELLDEKSIWEGRYRSILDLEAHLHPFLFVFLILAALYESWSLPFSVVLGTPIAVFGAFAALWSRHMVNNVYAQIGLVMLIGLAAKNAILIVEFARIEVEKGKPVMDAALVAARTRLRPILMTSFAFILGTVPLAIATGSRAIARRILGTVVIGGMLAATCIAVCLIPVAFYVVERLASSRRKEKMVGAVLGAETHADGTL
jgi:hypothetical protein